MPRFPYAVSLVALLIVVACKDGGGGGPIEASPASLDFGSVDFQGPPLNCDPDEGGCAPDVVLEATHEASIEIVPIEALLRHATQVEAIA